LTSAPFGLNLLLFVSGEEALEAVLAEQPHVASFSWAQIDQPLEDIFTRAQKAGCLVMHMVSQVGEARRAAEAGADIVVAQGTEGGGHVGVMATMPLVPQVVDAVAPTTVLAAGGIADGRGLAAALALGAEGVLLGTRFLATQEAPVPDALKQVILNSDGHDTDLTEIPDLIRGVVWPGAFGRTWRNALLEEWSGREWEVRQRRAEILAKIDAARAAGDYDRIPIMFGQDAGLISTIEPVADLVNRIVADAVAIIGDRMPSLMTASHSSKEPSV
jgi:NAD(P)H-dependent flavin oxidoreductase YrpB (nitropropane dioxygenase family)